MKKAIVTLFATVLAVVILHAYRSLQISSISGKVIPPEGVESIMAIGGSDTVRTSTSNGSFAITVSPGTWRLVIDAKEPYKDAILEKVEVKGEQNTDVGEIRLQQ